MIRLNDDLLTSSSDHTEERVTAVSSVWRYCDGLLYLVKGSSLMLLDRQMM